MADSYSVIQTTPAAPGETTLLSATIDISSSGDNTIIPGVTLQVIRVFRIFAISPSSVVVTPKDGVGGTEFTGPLTLGSFVLDFDGESWFTCSAGNAFVLNLGTAVQVSGRVFYTQG